MWREKKKNRKQRERATDGGRPAEGFSRGGWIRRARRCARVLEVLGAALVGTEPWGRVSKLTRLGRDSSCCLPENGRRTHVYTVECGHWRRRGAAMQATLRGPKNDDLPFHSSVSQWAWIKKTSIPLCICAYEKHRWAVSARKTSPHTPLRRAASWPFALSSWLYNILKFLKTRTNRSAPCMQRRPIRVFYRPSFSPRFD